LLGGEAGDRSLGFLLHQIGFPIAISGGFLLAKKPRAYVREETVTNWYDWRIAAVWLTAIGIASMIYFLPAARLVE
jgi:hypothetical protein